MSDRTAPLNVLCTIICHAQQNAADPVLGVLLSPKGAKNIVECVPLLHSYFQASVFETGLEIIQTYAESNDLSIQGLYYADEQTGDDNDDVRSNVKFLCTQVLKMMPEAPYAWCYKLINDSMTSSDGITIRLFTIDKNEKVKRSRQETMSRETFSEMEKVRVYDFEQYLEDPNLPWLILKSGFEGRS